MTANETVTAVISSECQRRHLTRAQLANTLGWGRDQVTRKLNGERRWTLEDLDQVSTVLGVPLPVLLMAPAAIATAEYRLAQARVTRWYRSLFSRDLRLSKVADSVSGCSLLSALLLPLPRTCSRPLPRTCSRPFAWPARGTVVTCPAP